MLNILNICIYIFFHYILILSKFVIIIWLVTSSTTKIKHLQLKYRNHFILMYLYVCMLFTARPSLFWVSSYMSLWSNILFNCAVIINLIVAFFYPFDHDDGVNSNNGDGQRRRMISGKISVQWPVNEKSTSPICNDLFFNGLQTSCSWNI